MTLEEATRRLAQEMVNGQGPHQMSTLNPAKVRILAAIHHAGHPCSDSDLTGALGWTRQYVYRMADELAVQGVLVRIPGLPRVGPGRPAVLYQCICSPNQEGIRS